MGNTIDSNMTNSSMTDAGSKAGETDTDDSVINEQEMASQESLTKLLLTVDEDEKEDEENEKQALMLVDQIAEEATGYCCAAEEKCGMNNAPFTNRDTHRCKTCEKRVHGMFCCVPQFEDEEGSIFYCLKCGRPEEDDPPKAKKEVTSTYNLRQTKKRDAATTLANLAEISGRIAKSTKTPSKSASKTSENSVKAPENPAKAPDTTAKAPKTTLGKQKESPTKSIKKPEKSIKRPEKIADVKGYNVARIFEVTARQVTKLQASTTWEEEEDRQEKPSCQYALLSCDEMLQKPFKKERYKRKTGQEQITLQTFEGFDHKKWGGRIKQMGADMEKGKKSGKNWKIVDNVLEHHERIFGSSMKFRPYGGDKKQADAYNDLLGAGYEDGDKKLAAKNVGKKKIVGKKQIQRKRGKKS